jgi:hypothetical protein
MHADEIETFMAGMTISGNRSIDGQPFTIAINANKTTSYQFAGSGKLEGTTQYITGRWWTEDAKFCMQMPKFAFGQQACPRIVKSGQTLTAIRPVNGVTLPWTITK